MESKDLQILGACGLRTKVYSLKYHETTKETLKLKGVPKSYVAKNLHYDMYKKCLLEGRDVKAQFYRFKTKNHKISKYNQTKQALSSFDDKRYQLYVYTYLFIYYKYLHVKLICIYIYIFLSGHALSIHSHIIQFSSRNIKNAHFAKYYLCNIYSRIIRYMISSS